METRLLGYDKAANMTEIADWANALPGKEFPGTPGYRVRRIVSFQILPGEEGYAAMVMVEIEEMSQDVEQTVIREADVIEIEEITSSVGEPPEKPGPLVSE
ncbi:hypothetical protein EPA93_27655 [Ktedonosporobacter rubrisoli]|uniref:Uncharacterized protein n=1 Tax=Ktedonosporobacter rubrisoli TaxID=2509675 RepID=A0A4P6JW09_KTERU|nr:hypothetical protein [Ktedonosporobacter rubrisoli]QBD79550.1 hypothetical protein EPA93_27655 [Ktedonosporobacter rubrisoli]